MNAEEIPGNDDRLSELAERFFAALDDSVEHLDEAETEAGLSRLLRRYQAEAAITPQEMDIPVPAADSSLLYRAQLQQALIIKAAQDEADRIITKAEHRAAVMEARWTAAMQELSTMQRQAQETLAQAQVISDAALDQAASVVSRAKKRAEELIREAKQAAVHVAESAEPRRRWPPENAGRTESWQRLAAMALIVHAGQHGYPEPDRLPAEVIAHPRSDQVVPRSSAEPVPQRFLVHDTVSSHVFRYLRYHDALDPAPKVIGPPGTGRTRLVCELIQSLADDAPARVFLISSTVGEAAHVMVLTLHVDDKEPGSASPIEIANTRDIAELSG